MVSPTGAGESIMGNACQADEGQVKVANAWSIHVKEESCRDCGDIRGGVALTLRSVPVLKKVLTMKER